MLLWGDDVAPCQVASCRGLRWKFAKGSFMHHLLFMLSLSGIYFIMLSAPHCTSVGSLEFMMNVQGHVRLLTSVASDIHCSLTSPKIHRSELIQSRELWKKVQLQTEIPRYLNPGAFDMLLSNHTIQQKMLFIRRSCLNFQWCTHVTHKQANNLRRAWRFCAVNHLCRTSREPRGSHPYNVHVHAASTCNHRAPDQQILNAEPERLIKKVSLYWYHLSRWKCVIGEK